MREPIKVGDLVKFKHHIFDEYQPAFLVTEAWDSPHTDPLALHNLGRVSQCIKVHGLDLTQRASNFVIISRACN